jgi:hypothetical protein
MAGHVVSCIRADGEFVRMPSVLDRDGAGTYVGAREARISRLSGATVAALS